MFFGLQQIGVRCGEKVGDVLTGLGVCDAGGPAGRVRLL
jgi:hypothetical protein